MAEAFLEGGKEPLDRRGRGREVVQVSGAAIHQATGDECPTTGQDEGVRFGELAEQTGDLDLEGSEHD